MVHILTICTWFSHFCQEISIVANTRFGGQFWRNLVGGGTKTFHWTGRKCSKFIQFDINTLLHIQGGFFTGSPPTSSKCQSVSNQTFKIHWWHCNNSFSTYPKASSVSKWQERALIHVCRLDAPLDYNAVIPSLLIHRHWRGYQSGYLNLFVGKFTYWLTLLV